MTDDDHDKQSHGTYVLFNALGTIGINVRHIPSHDSEYSILINAGWKFYRKLNGRHINVTGCGVGNHCELPHLLEVLDYFG